MLHAHDVIRRRIEPQDQLNTEELKRSEWSEHFERLMRNRMIIGAFRYGRLHDKMKPRFDRVSYIKTKLARYEETGNLEALVDVANLCLLEFEEGCHPKRHFKAMDATDEHCGVKEIPGELRKLSIEEAKELFGSVKLVLEKK